MSDPQAISWHCWGGGFTFQKVFTHRHDAHMLPNLAPPRPSSSSGNSSWTTGLIVRWAHRKGTPFSWKVICKREEGSTPELHSKLALKTQTDSWEQRDILHLLEWDSSTGKIGDAGIATFGKLSQVKRPFSNSDKRPWWLRLCVCTEEKGVDLEEYMSRTCGDYNIPKQTCLWISEWYCIL